MGSFWGFVCRQPPPANPFSKPPKNAPVVEDIPCEGGAGRSSRLVFEGKSGSQASAKGSNRRFCARGLSSRCAATSGWQGNSCGTSRVRKFSPKFSCIKFFQIRDVPTQIPGHPGHSLSKTTEKGPLHKVFVRDIPTSGSRMSQEYPAQKLYL